MSVRVLYSLKLKVAPHPYQKLVPLNALLPVILRYPLNIFILSLKANRIKKSSMNNEIGRASCRERVCLYV